MALNDRLSSSLFAGLVVFSGILVPTAQALAQTALPPVLQAALIAKVFQGDATLRAKVADTAKLLLVSGPQFDASLTALDEALGPTRIETRKVTEANVPSVTDVQAVYLPGRLAVDAVQKLCADRSLLSIGGDVAMAEAGVVSVGLGINAAGKPEVVINMRRLALEHHTLSPALLKLARVINP